MAHIELNDGKRTSITSEQGAKIWEILQGRREPDNKAQELYVSKIRRIYLNWRNAPDDYIEQNYDYVTRMAMVDWITDDSGKPIRPSDNSGFAFAKQWGLKWK